MTGREALNELWINCEGKAMVKEYETVRKELDKINDIKDLLTKKSLYGFSNEKVVEELEKIIEK